MLRTKSKYISAILIFVISLFVMVSSVLIVINRQMIIDQITVWQYKPTSDISAITSRSGLNDYGKFLFYASRPELDKSQTFNGLCNRIENSTAILGCYSNDRIYLYDVTDTRLDGIREVTAVHETLHAAYQRLSSNKKSEVNKLLEAEYTKLKTNTNFASLIKYYDSAEPGQRDNELNSIVGTEVASVSPELEDYYRQYFSDRQQIVKLYYQYNDVFQELSVKASALADQLKNLTTKITTESDKYNSDIKQLNADITDFNERANNNEFTSLSTFYSERENLMSRINAVAAERSSIEADISSYNTNLNEYNSTTAESKELYNSIDSTLVPVPSV